ncbi:MAG: nucleotide exchange factor GrpE, partial [Acidobacteria bacterium]|nr:nucleotide exchange factor GrpE [Acidobacteriota bacterium]
MSDMKVTDRRWWAKEQSESGEPVSEEPRLKPAYVEELEQKIATKDLEIQQLIAKYRSASSEFDDARARLRKELSKDVERGRRSMIVSFLEVLDNLDRALEAGGDRGA